MSAIRRMIPFLALALAVTASAAACNNGNGETPLEMPTAAVVTARVVNTYPHDPEAFTQGLLWHDGLLMESTGRYGESSLRRTRLEDGAVADSVRLDRRYFGEGVAVLDGRAYQLTWRENTMFVYDAATLAPLDTMRWNGEGWGVTTDGRQLIVSDGSSRLQFADPATLQVTRTVEVMDGVLYVGNLNELEWIDGEIWANVWHTDRIARIDPGTGWVKQWVDLTGLNPEAGLRDAEAVLNGIAHDPATGRIFVTGKLWNALFEIEVPGVSNGAAAASADSGA